MHKNISVLIVTYNQVNYIEEALKSVLEQDMDYIKEIVISDDGSTDGTLEIIKKYQQNYNDLIKVVENNSRTYSTSLSIEDKHKNIRANYIRGIGACADDSDFIALLEGDDYWYPNKIKYLMDYIKDNNIEISKYSLIFHKYSLLQDGVETDRYYRYENDCEVTLEDTILDYQIQNLSCCIYNAKILKNSLEKFINAPGVDFAINVIVQEQLPALFIGLKLSIYRLCGGGALYGLLLARILKRYTTYLDVFNITRFLKENISRFLIKRLMSMLCA